MSFAMPMICSRLSTEQGPDMMTISLPPMVTSPILTTRGLAAEFAGDEFVGLEHGRDGLDAGDGGDRLFADDILRPDDADDHALRAAARLRLAGPTP